MRNQRWWSYSRSSPLFSCLFWFLEMGEGGEEKTGQGGVAMPEIGENPGAAEGGAPPVIDTADIAMQPGSTVLPGPAVRRWKWSCIPFIVIIVLIISIHTSAGRMWLKKTKSVPKKEFLNAFSAWSADEFIKFNRDACQSPSPSLLVHDSVWRFYYVCIHLFEFSIFVILLFSDKILQPKWRNQSCKKMVSKLWSIISL